MTQAVPKWIYAFGGGRTEGNAGMVALLGSKGAGLAEMCCLGLPVPPGFTLTTAVCAHYFVHGNAWPTGLENAVDAALTGLGGFANPEAPLLVSVRSGAPVSMPGMMDTVLNLGLNAVTVEALARRTGDPRFAYDSYRRFIQMYAAVVLGIDPGVFETILDDARDAKGVDLDTELDADDLKRIAAQFTAQVAQHTGAQFPQDPRAQLWGAIEAVFRSWRSPRAIAYRRLHGLEQEGGTAVTVQTMVFGNRGADSAAGVVFTRDPATGDPGLYGEYLVNAQGEDVVAGIRTPQPLTIAARGLRGGKRAAMEEAMPAAFAELRTTAELLERHYRDVPDIEFTVQDGALFLLQTRPARRTAAAALKIAVDMEREGLIARDVALTRVDPQALGHLLLPVLDPDAPRELIARGLGASPGAAMGEVVFTADEAEEVATNRRDAILVRTETSPEDIAGLYAARGALTARGGMTSHAAVVARGLGRPCVTGAGSLKIDALRGEMRCDSHIVRRGDLITIDGTTGQVFRGAVAMRQPEPGGDFATILQWADAARRLQVRANADTAAQAALARRMGAEGVGLCRIEAMLQATGGVAMVREAIVARTPSTRNAALAALLPALQADLQALFNAAAGGPVTVRLLGISQDGIATSGEDFERVRQEILQMQARAIFQAVLTVEGATADIAVPAADLSSAQDCTATFLCDMAEVVTREQGKAPSWRLGAVIETPRDAMRAGDIARRAKFLIFDGGMLAEADLRDAPMPGENVEALIQYAVEQCRAVEEDLELGFCAAQKCDTQAIHFCHDSGLDFVTCSSVHVPVVRLIAAQAAIIK